MKNFFRLFSVRQLLAIHAFFLLFCLDKISYAQPELPPDKEVNLFVFDGNADQLSDVTPPRDKVFVLGPNSTTEHVYCSGVGTGKARGSDYKVTEFYRVINSNFDEVILYLKPTHTLKDGDPETEFKTQFFYDFSAGLYQAIYGLDARLPNENAIVRSAGALHPFKVLAQEPAGPGGPGGGGPVGP